jgi:hypothetical protein
MCSSAALAEDGKPDEFDPTAFGWSTTPEKLKSTVETTLKTEHFGSYKRYSHTVTLNAESWQRFFVFHNGDFIAQGYARSEKLPKPRVGTMSDVVSYDNNHWVTKMVTQKHGKPSFQDARTRTDYSEELGDDALRVKRSLEWDLQGERYRWELENGTLRYTVQYSMDGLAEHRLVNVNPGSWSHYFEFQTAQAFRDAGIRLIRRFHTRTNKWVVKSVSPSGDVKIKKYNPPDSAKPRSATRDQWSTSNCRISGKKCDITYKYYGGHLYEVEIDLSESGKFPRRGHHEKIGKAFYKHFLAVDSRLKRYLGSPGDNKQIKNLDNRRSLLKAENLVQGQEGFWSIWFDVGNDILVRHTISGESRGDGFHIDHKVTFRFHNVARALAEQDSWKSEAASDQ